ncbi:MAG: hypothetical protein PUD16_09575 [bacterium]|nr:hypothetical protein [bacterium]
MKKLLCMLLALVLALGCLTAACAGEDWYTIGEGDKNVLLLIKVLDEYVYGYELRTNQSNLLDALWNIGLVDGEQASWGYNVTRVDGFKAIPEENGAYWTILTYNDEQQSFQSAGEAISEIGTEDYTAIAFVRNTENVPYTEKMIYMAVKDENNELQTYEILTEDQSSVLECLLENGLVSGEEASWGFNVTEAAGVKADYDNDGTYFNILQYNDDSGEFEHMDRSLASMTIDELPEMPEMAAFAFVLSK